MRLLALLSAIWLVGCATPLPDSHYHWYHSGREPLPMAVHQVSQDDVQALCCNSNAHILACAWRDYERKRCDVFTSYPSLPAETLLHEKRHCDGEEHQVLAPIANPKQCKTPIDLGY